MHQIAWLFPCAIPREGFRTLIFLFFKIALGDKTTLSKTTFVFGVGSAIVDSELFLSNQNSSVDMLIVPTGVYDKHRRKT